MAPQPGEEGGPPDAEGQPPRRKPRAKKEPIEFGDLVRYGVLTGKIEQKEQRIEVESRLRIEEARDRHARRKDLMILIAVLIGLGAICGACLVVAFIGSADDKKWAMSVPAAIVSTGVGFLGGKAYRDRGWDA